MIHKYTTLLLSLLCALYRGPQLLIFYPLFSWEMREGGKNTIRRSDLELLNCGSLKNLFKFSKFKNNPKTKKKLTNIKIYIIRLNMVGTLCCQFDLLILNYYQASWFIGLFNTK